MSISVSSSGSMSPKDQFSFDKKIRFSQERLTSGLNASVDANTSTGYNTAKLIAPYVVGAAGGAVGYACIQYYHTLQTRGQVYISGIDWTKKVTFGMRVVRNVGSTLSADSEFRVNLGNYYATGINSTANPVVGVNCVGFKQSGATGALVFMASNLTSVSSVTTTFVPAKDVAYDVIIESVGGVANMYVNDNLIGTLTTAPTTQSTGGSMSLWATVENKLAIVTPEKPQDVTVGDYFLTVL
jgi:hypothetical protein